MHNDWILDVLADLRRFALANDFSALAEQLDDATLVAANEIASKAKGAGHGPRLHGDDCRAGCFDRKAGSH